MADGGVEGAVEGLVGGGEDDEFAVGGKVFGGVLHLGGVVFDVFEDVDVEDGVEALVGGEVVGGAAGAGGAGGRGGVIEFEGEGFGEGGVGFEAGPGFVDRVDQDAGGGTDAGADFE